MIKHWNELTTEEKQIHLGFKSKKTLSKSVIVYGAPSRREFLVSQEDLIADRIEEREFEEAHGVIV